MIDRTYAGRRCRTRRLVRTVEGILQKGSRGTVVYEMDNLGRRLILVRWDTGITVPVFPEEIELEREYAAPLYQPCPEREGAACLRQPKEESSTSSLQ